MQKKSLVIKLLTIFFLVWIAIACNQKRFFPTYIIHIFLPIQKARHFLLKNIPFSVGDIVYAIAIIIILMGCFAIIKSLIQFKSCKTKLLNQFLNVVLGFSLIYTLFVLGWGANYNRAPIVAHYKDLDTMALIALNQKLIEQFNQFNPQQSTFTLQSLNSKLNSQYHQWLGEAVPNLQIKPTLFGSTIQYFGIQGYYNPFTGEGQFSSNLPKFMWPFVVAHEMAHQTSITDEGEANFMAYIICVTSPDTTIQYSGYLNLYLYVSKQLELVSPIQSQNIVKQLPNYVQQDIKTLKLERLKYRSGFSKIIMQYYNWYLKINGLDAGIESYAQITSNVYFWERASRPKYNIYVFQ